jgi:glycosyltransferase involved in cell wall biosynthesis
VHISTAPSAAVAGILANGFPWHPVAVHRASRAPWREAKALVDIGRLYRRLRPDIVHHVTPKPVLYGTIAARITGVPAVVNAISGMGHAFADESGLVHGALQRLISAGYRVALRHPRTRVIFQNVDARADFIRRGWVRASETVLIRGSGVDVASFTVEARPERVPVVVLAARLLRTKGVGEFVAAARMLLTDGVRARFVLVGEPDSGNPATVTEAELRAWVADGTVEWWGHRTDMPRVLEDADIACLPSYYPEGLPKSLIEAAAAGLPIVTTDQPGCREVVRDGENGSLVPPRDPARLAAALRPLLDDRTLRERMGAAGRTRAEAEFTLDQVVRAHLAIYGALTG